MEVHKRTPHEIFNMPQRLLVPLFQRPYVWSEEAQWEPLWEDIIRVASWFLASPQASHQPHFIGAVVLQQMPNSTGGFQERTIIDGQQRLTTLQILLDAMHAEFEHAGATKPAKRLERLIRNDEEFCSHPEDEFKVWPTNRDRPACCEVMTATAPVDYNSLAFKKDRLPQAHKYFSEQVRKWLHEGEEPDIAARADALETTARELLQIVVIDLAADENAQEIFETPNARGAQLSAADLIKNFIFQRLLLEGADTESAYEQDWKQFETAFWEKEVSSCRNYQNQEDTEVLLSELMAEIAITVKPFVNIDRDAPIFNQIHDAQQILDNADKRDDFAAQFMRCQGLFEFLWPEMKLPPIEEDYRFLAKVYASIAPNKAADLLLWQKLGAKTMAIVHARLTGVTIDADQLEKVAMDAGVLEALKDETLFPQGPSLGKPLPTALEVLHKLEERIKRRFGGEQGNKVWRSLSERLELLRLSRIASAEESVDFLKRLLELAKDLLEAEKADDEGRIDDIKVVDPRKGALTQIFESYRPDGVPVVIENVVEQVDSLVTPVRNTGWQSSHPGDRLLRQELRLILNNNGLPPAGELFERAYAYIRENY